VCCGVHQCTFLVCHFLVVHIVNGSRSISRTLMEGRNEVMIRDTLFAVIRVSRFSLDATMVLVLTLHFPIV
jgi:hypothetical protein